MERKFPVEFTEGQASALLQLIDLAVKSGGMNVAEAGVVLTTIIKKAAIKAAQEESQKNEGPPAISG